MGKIIFNWQIILLISAAIIFSACSKGAEQEQASASESSVSETAEIPEPSPAEDFEYTVKNGEVRLKAYIGTDTNVVIPEYIEDCPVVKYDNRFLENTDVAEITFPQTITVIGEIKGANELETINISSAVSKLYPIGLAECKDLKNINAEKGDYFISIDGVLYSADGKTVVCFPAGRTGEFTVPDDVEVIGSNAFYKSSLTSVVLPPKLASIGMYSFAYSRLTSVLFPASLAEIDDFAFTSSGLNNAELPDGLRSIGNSVFAYTNISEIRLPDSVESCGRIFGYDEADQKISAPLSAIYTEGMSSLLEYENVVFRGETDLDRLLRITGEIDPEYSKGRIFIDLDGDNFPEMINVGKYVKDFRRFNISEGTWEYILSIYAENALNLYHDKKTDEYFYIYTESWESASGCSVYKLIITDDGFEWDHECLGQFTYHSGGYWNEEKNEYIRSAYVEFGYMNGRYFIGENDPDFENDAFKEAMSEYELVNTVNIQKIIDEYGDEDQIYEIVMSAFSDSPEPSAYKKPLREKSEEYDFITIGERSIAMDSQAAHLSGEEVTEENFEKLSHLPRLTTLSIGSGRYDSNDNEMDLTGIDKISGLAELSVYGYSAKIKNASEIGKLKNLKVLYISPNADDLTFLTEMDNLLVIEFGNTMDKPADFYKPIYGMKNLRYLLMDWWDRNITQEQEEHITKNAPHINIMGYKWG